MHTKVNVVIPAYKPDEKLIKIFEMLSKQSVTVEKIIVMNSTVVGGSNAEQNADTDEVRTLCIKHDYDIKNNFIEIYNIPQAEFDHGATRNLGASHVSTDCEFIVFMTQDAVPYDELLIEKLMAPFSDEQIGASYARQLAGENSSLAEKFTRGFNYPDEDRIKTVSDIDTIGVKAFFCSNVCAMYRRSVYEELGRFVDRAIFNEDMVYANKLLKSGYNIAYCSKAKVVHTHDYSGMQQFKRNFDLAVSQKMNPQAFDGISSESEGIKYVKAAFLYFLRHGRPFLIIPFGINCVYKYAGYRMGKRYESLPKEKIMKYTSNPGFFNKER